MNGLGRLLTWLGRKVLLYAMLVVAIGVATFVLPWAKTELGGARRAETRFSALDDASRRFGAEIDSAAKAWRDRAAALRGQSVAAIDTQAAALRRERAGLDQQVQAAGPTWAVALKGSEAVLATQRLKLRIAAIDAELDALAQARALALADAQTIGALSNVQQQAARMAQTAARCAEARRAQQAFEDRWRWRLRSWFDSEEHRALARQSQFLCQQADQARLHHDRLVEIDRLAQVERARAERALELSAAAFEQRAAPLRATLVAEAERAGVEWSGSLTARAKVWAERVHLDRLLRQAAIALLLILATPYLIRLLCFFVLAPIAMRRPSIRLTVPGGRGADIPPAPRSATSVTIRLETGEELLVRQDYLQTSSEAGAKRTQWLLDRRHPLTSLVTGLTFLTHIRGDGQATTISAVRDPFSEVTVLTLPEGASCVLQPRALAAVAQPIGRPLHVTSQWRLGSLNAWLTLQFRYLIFHGPVRLVLKGGRGIRVEAAEQGRVFGQDQLVGFSADLAYSVTRTETFWPYFLGREQLLKDRVQAGAGMLIIEEAPMSTRKDGEVRHGIEGTIDAVMKAFGL